ncbi:hypothetical protein D7294_08530 [Streptomyces hoynatensis]|uniref:MaoC-like domain-containing protein n=1 Tax=Streptomyces hoynatensis TaxID=1141874 RepID=A0A3A9Z700_9ACTN|nr:hypothetical protein D7294_08530 [Streptomyces hoynatensis]
MGDGTVGDGATGEWPGAEAAAAGHPAAVHPAAGRPAAGRSGGEEEPGGAWAAEEWTVPAAIGRRYAAVSGDRNPIHLHPLTARPFGFRRALAHGMWTKARCLAALAERGALPEEFTVTVTFRAPVLLPALVTFRTRGGAFGLRGEDGRREHLRGLVSPHRA